MIRSLTLRRYLEIDSKLLHEKVKGREKVETYQEVYREIDQLNINVTLVSSDMIYQRVIYKEANDIQKRLENMSRAFKQSRRFIYER